MEKRYDLTSDEANTLLAVGAGGEAFPEIVVSTRLTPSKTRHVVERLVEKNLAVRDGDQVIELTADGRNAYRYLAREQLQNVPQSPGSQGVMIVPDSETPYATANSSSSRDMTKLDQAIDAELAKLSG